MSLLTLITLKQYYISICTFYILLFLRHLQLTLGYELKHVVIK